MEKAFVESWSGIAATLGASPVVEGESRSAQQAIGTGFDHACAISKNGAVQCWVGNAYGQLGDGSSRQERGLLGRSLLGGCCRECAWPAVGQSRIRPPLACV